tara:strand:- start:133 stop:462 length:330 start_codon:yes stop_codon:yes gene_type:complete
MLPWLNPTEVLWSHGDNMAALQAALHEAHPECAAREVTVRGLVDALCTGPALDAAVAELRRRQAWPHEQHVPRTGPSPRRLRDEHEEGDDGRKRRRTFSHHRDFGKNLN